MTDFFLIMPELVLALTLAFVVAGEITYFGEQSRFIILISLLGLSSAFVQTLISYQSGAAQIFNGVLSVDGFSLFFKLLFIFSAALTIAVVSHTREISENRRSEYCTLVLASTLAMCLLSSSADLILIFLTLLFLNVVSYFLAAFGRQSVISTEAAVKYLAFGSVCGALLLYALAILFASTHSLNIYEMHRSLVAAPLSSNVMLVVFMLTFLALAFQVGAFPMYLIVPDVLEGSPTPVSSFLSMGARTAGFAVAVRLLVVVFAQPSVTAGQWRVLGEIDWPEIVSIVSGLTMIFGALLAFRQKGAKRLVACLIVAQTGFLLMGVLVLDEVGIAAVLYNLVVDLFALMGSFYVLAFFYDDLQSDQFEKLRGMLRRSLPECICLIVFLLTLVGSPPTAGFIGKFSLIGVAVRHQRMGLAMAAVIAIVISTAAVARLAFYLVGDFKMPAQPVIVSPVSRKIFLFVLLIPTVLIGVFANLVFRWAGQSLGFIFW